MLRENDLKNEEKWGRVKTQTRTVAPVPEEESVAMTSLQVAD